MTKRRHVAWLAAVVCLVASCQDDAGSTAELSFSAQREFLPGFEHDTGWVPAQSPASIRVLATAAGSTTIVALATSDGSMLEPVPGSGQISVEGGLHLEVSARIDAAGVEYEGVVEEFDYMLESASVMFEPFLLDGEATVQSALPAAELARVPIPSVPGATLIMEVTGGELTTAFTGTCAEVLDGIGQYQGRTTTTGTVDMAGTIEIEIPIVGTETFGPFELAVPIPELTEDVDLGALSVSTGEPVPGATACAGGSGSDTDDPDGTTSGGDSSDAGTASDPSTTDPTGASSTSGGSTTSAEDTGGESSETGGETGDTSGDPVGDPFYPDPDGMCPAGTDPVVISDTELGYCAPQCQQNGDCPQPASGMASPSCSIAPTSSFDACKVDLECPEMESCMNGTCVTAPTHCVLDCEIGQCPESMLCTEGVCLYP